MGNNLYSNLVNFYNVNDENFKEFMAEIYKEMLLTHRDVQYVKEHLTEEIEKILDIYLVDGKFNINIEEKVNEFLENNQVIKDINSQLDNKTNKINSCDFINAKEYGLKGDGVTDDSNKLQELINYCISINKAIFFPKGVYRLTKTITINAPIFLYGFGISGLSNYLGGADTTLLIDHSEIGFLFNPSSTYFNGCVIEDLCFRRSDNYNNTQATGVNITKFNHMSFNRVSFQEFRNGKAVDFTSESGFGGQYSSFTNCKFGMCLIGVEVNSYNSIIFMNNMFDGNNNCSYISQYETGVPSGSIAINLVGGDSHKIVGNRIQGFETAIKINSNYNSLSDCRIEACSTGIELTNSTQKNNLGTGLNFNNYILLSKNGLPSSGLYGYAIKNYGSKNIINPFIYGSCKPIIDDEPTTDKKYLQKINIFIPEISTTTQIPLQIDKNKSTSSYYIKNLKISVGNFSSIDTTYGNRWKVEISGKYKEFYNETYTDNNYYEIGSSPNARNKDIDLITFTKYGNATTLKNVAIYCEILPY